MGQVYDMLTAVKDRLIKNVTGLQKGNCLVTVESVDIPHMGGTYVEVYAADSQFMYEDGGNLGRRLTIGVSIRRVIKVDRVSGLVRATQELVLLADAITERLHMWHDPNLMTQPVFGRNENKPRLVPGGRGLYVIDQTYEAFFLSVVPSPEG